MRNNYTLYARIYPALICLAPILIIGGAYSFHLESYFPLVFSTIISSAMLHFAGQLARDRGKRKEPELWNEWGGTPSVQILRFSDSHLDSITKKRYHSILSNLAPVEADLTEDFEKEYPLEADAIYLSWTKYMIAKTRDTTKYNLLFQENRNYGFRRNLWGLKPISLFLLFLGLIGNFLYQIYQGYPMSPHFSLEFIVSELLLITLLCIWLFVITKTWIKPISFSYAERLFEQSLTIQEQSKNKQL